MNSDSHKRTKCRACMEQDVYLLVKKLGMLKMQHLFFYFNNVTGQSTHREESEHRCQRSTACACKGSCFTSFLAHSLGISFVVDWLAIVLRLPSPEKAAMPLHIALQEPTNHHTTKPPAPCRHDCHYTPEYAWMSHQITTSR